MAETRKFDASGSEGIQKLVREALGETVRPVQPGEIVHEESQLEEVIEHEAEAPRASDLTTVEYLSFPLD